MIIQIGREIVKYLPKKDSYIYSDEDEFDEEIKYFLNLDK